MPKACAGEKIQHKALDCSQPGRSAGPTQRKRACGIDDPEQIEDEQDPEAIVDNDRRASGGELRMIDVFELEPGQQHRVSTQVNQKPGRARCLHKTSKVQLPPRHEWPGHGRLKGKRTGKHQSIVCASTLFGNASTPIRRNDCFEFPILNKVTLIEPYGLVADLAEDIVRV